ncbi:hypothetical protein [Rhodoferax sp. TH121]|uniref:hypothetical protein n=1 Tax=Rhodoferax sp. TH121 TaxID=2022803 RepID=UPI0020CC83C1|nr:hypothetical protein [Rhodoferax sp. TH121]
MLLKTADEKSKRLALMEDLQKSTLLDIGQKDWLRDELRRCKTGIEGERAAAFYLDGHYKDAQNNALLHDLRFVVDGEVAHIDHPVTGCILVARAYPAKPSEAPQPVDINTFFEKALIDTVQILGIQINSRLISKMGAFRVFAANMAAGVAAAFG